MDFYIQLAAPFIYIYIYTRICNLTIDFYVQLAMPYIYIYIRICNLKWIFIYNWQHLIYIYIHTRICNLKGIFIYNWQTHYI